MKTPKILLCCFKNEPPEKSTLSLLFLPSAAGSHDGHMGNLLGWTLFGSPGASLLEACHSRRHIAAFSGSLRRRGESFVSGLVSGQTRRGIPPAMTPKSPTARLLTRSLSGEMQNNV